MQVDEKARIAAADAIWNEFLYHVDTVACGDRFQTPDAAMARRISDIAIAAYLSALGEQKPIAFVSKRVIDALDVNGTEIVDAMLFPRGTLRPTEARPLYASTLPVRPITDEDDEAPVQTRLPRHEDQGIVMDRPCCRLLQHDADAHRLRRRKRE